MKALSTITAFAFLAYAASAIPPVRINASDTPVAKFPEPVLAPIKAIPAPPVCSGGTCSVSILTTSGSDADPIQVASDLVVADTQKVKAAQAKVAALAAAQADLVTIQAQLASDRANLNALLDPLGPAPTPGPGPSPSTHTVAIVAVTDPATCAPCRVLQPILTALAASGVPITYLGSADPAASKWGVAATPTLILTVDGSEPNGGKTPGNTRVIGLTAAATQPILAKWVSDCQAWVKQKYGQGSELPAPPGATQ